MRPEDSLAAAIERYARLLCRDIRNPRTRKAVTTEYIEHLEDTTAAYLRQGLPESDALHAALADLGDPERVQTLLVVTHNGDGLPQGFRWLMGLVGWCAAMAGHLLAEKDAVRTALGFVLAVGLTVLAWRCLHRLRLFVRALIKRKHAKMRLSRFAAENRMTFTEHKNPYLSLLFHSETPEWVVDTSDCRYILSLFPTFELHNKIHFHENGLYVTAKESGFLSRFAFGRMHTMREAEITYGIFSMPSVDFERFHAQDRENIPILLLNPAPCEIDISRNGHVRRLHPDEAMPAPYGGARACSASDLIRQLGLKK